jgi:hypothetical protein
MASTLYTSGTVVSSPWLNDVDTATYNSLTAVAGTNTITATGPLSMLAIAAGDRFYFVPAVTNTAAVTINISGLGVQPITKYGSTNLEAGDLVAGQMALIVYDGSLFQLLNPRKFDTTQTVPAANLTGTVAIANGGTGASTAATALSNLGVPPVGFRAHNNGVGTLIPSAAFTTLLMGTEVFDSGGFFAANAWTPPAGRLVTMSGNVILTSAGAGSAGILSIFKNGVEYARGTLTALAAATTYGLHVSVVDLPNGTDVYTLRVFQNSGLNITTDGVAANTWFAGGRM